MTGRKLEQKVYRHYTGYPGGLKETSARRLLETKPEELVREAVLGMLPKSRLGSRLAQGSATEGLVKVKTLKAFY